jgi:hypothetical protein
MSKASCVAYLDHDLVSAIPNHDLKPQEEDAFAWLRRRSKRRGLKLVASKVSLREISAAPIEHRAKYYQTLHRLPEVEFIEDHTLMGFNVQDLGRYGFIASPLIEDNPVSAWLQKIGVKRLDAHHLTVAIKHRCDVFLTCDRGILHRRKMIESEYRIRVMLPSQLMQELRRLSNGGNSRCGKLHDKAAK